MKGKDERILFGKEIKSNSDLGVIKEVKNQDAGYVSAIFLRDEKNLKSINNNVAFNILKCTPCHI